jgi:hypothetical protein
MEPNVAILQSTHHPVSWCRTSDRPTTWPPRRPTTTCTAVSADGRRMQWYTIDYTHVTKRTTAWIFYPNDKNVAKLYIHVYTKGANTDVCSVTLTTSTVNIRKPVCQPTVGLHLNSRNVSTFAAVQRPQTIVKWIYYRALVHGRNDDKTRST